MVVLPIVEREFRQATLRPLTYRVRTGAAMAAAIIGLFGLNQLDSWLKSAGIGRALFQLASALAGVFTTSLCLSEERRHGTLGLLFLTDVGAYGVVAGKLVNASINAVQVLMGVFPVLALSIALGGVSVGEFWRMSIVLLSTLLPNHPLSCAADECLRVGHQGIGGVVVGRVGLVGCHSPRVRQGLAHPI